MAPTPGSPEAEAIIPAYKAQLKFITQDKAFLDRMIEFFATQLTTGQAQFEYLGHQKAICEAEQDLALAIGRTEHQAYWHEMERRVNWGRVRSILANREVQEEIGKMKKKREEIDEKARAIIDNILKLMPIDRPTDGGT